jgi:pyruvate kinase
MTLLPSGNHKPGARRAKIVCTVGPASHSRQMIDKLMRAGMDVARLNFSHGTHADHAATVKRLRAASGRHEKPIAILADLPGPKIRTGELEDGKPVLLRAGQEFTIWTTERVGDNEGVSISYPTLHSEVQHGDRILLSDGLIELRVESSGRQKIACRVVNGGQLGEHKGVNLPGVKLRVPALTPKDMEDLRFALRCGVNYIGVSFVRRAEDVMAAKRAVARAGYHVPIIAKIEKPEAIDNLDAILEIADGVMVARGDLGVEMNPERVPVVQKMLIAKAREARKPVITATQMLESMTENPRPTRAEASDVANAIFDGTDAVMLSGETAMGRYPEETVQMMDRIVREAEASIVRFARPHQRAKSTLSDAIAELICHASEELEMKVIAVFTDSGSTALLISKHRSQRPIIAFSANQHTRRQIALCWGVTPRRTPVVRNIDEMASIAERRLLNEGLVKHGDLVGIVAGTPFGVRGGTNLIKFHVVGSTIRRKK